MTARCLFPFTQAVEKYFDFYAAISHTKGQPLFFEAIRPLTGAASRHVW